MVSGRGTPATIVRFRDAHVVASVCGAPGILFYFILFYRFQALLRFCPETRRDSPFAGSGLSEQCDLGTESQAKLEWERDDDSWREKVDWSGQAPANGGDMTQLQFPLRRPSQTPHEASATDTPLLLRETGGT